MASAGRAPLRLRTIACASNLHLDRRMRAGSVFDDVIRAQQQRRRDGEVGCSDGLAPFRILSTYVTARRNTSGMSGA